MAYQTKSITPGWDRVVDLYVSQNCRKIEGLSDHDNCKLILFLSGNAYTIQNGKRILYTSPCLLCVGHHEQVDIQGEYLADVVYLKGITINDHLTNERLVNRDLYHELSLTEYQDAILLNPFYEENRDRCVPLLPQEVNNLRKMITHMNLELSGQADGFWPCRSRSYLIQLLFYIQNLGDFFENIVLDESQKQTDYLLDIMHYISAHLSEKITLESLVWQFGINRNKMREDFIDKVGKPPITYLIQKRMELAAVLLLETELPVSEIAVRTGFPDATNFSRKFKQEYQMTPLQYRRG